jgi:argininosuccinate lyase
VAKLWKKGYDLNKLVEAFTVGNDYLLDRELVASDCLASIAHARMLHTIGILSRKELSSLEAGLRKILRENIDGRFKVLPEDEDVHTAIENRLTEEAGEAGKRIHTGRSRNDQVIAALRLYERAFLLDFAAETAGLIDIILSFVKEHEWTPMPGRTHLQIAMPSSVGLWAAAFAEELLGHVSMFPALYALIDQCPLGSAAGYGVPIPLDRGMVADLLGFERVQNNVLYVGNSRGLFEGWLMSAIELVGTTLSRFAQDMMLFSLPEFGYFSLPEELCTGSSIMPQKKNPDILELLRARASSLSAHAAQVRSIIRSLPTGYNRDVQETKEPMMKSSRLIVQCLQVMSLTIKNLKVNSAELEAAFTPGIYATDAVLERVKDGVSFREAYREVASAIGDVETSNPKESIRARTYPGTTGNLNLGPVAAAVAEHRKYFENLSARVGEKQNELAGFEVSVFT